MTALDSYISQVAATAAPPVHRAAQPTATRRDPVGPGTYLAFCTGWLMAVSLFVYAPLRMLSWAGEQFLAGRAAAATVAILLAGAGLLGGVRWCAFSLMALWNHRRDVARPLAPPLHWPRVSILAPAYNEGDTIEAAIESLLAMDYPSYEVVVVDDGSRDETLRRARRYAGDYADGRRRCTVRVFTKPNGGKWSALNYAFERSSGELVLCVDADSRVVGDSLRRLVARMNDPSVAAVAGQVRVRNRVNLVTRLQGLEYIIANGLIRTAQSLSGTVLVVPGPIGLFRRSVMEGVYLSAAAERESSACDVACEGDVAGPFEGDTFAEDFDMSLAILAQGGRVVYEPRAVSHTKAPEGVARLLNQRYRWSRGTIQVLRKFARRARRRPELLHPRLAAWLSVTYVAELLLLPLLNLVAAAFTCTYLAGGGDVAPLLAWAAAFMLVNANAATFFAALHEEPPTALAVLPIYDLYHSVLLNAGWAIAVVDELRRTRMRW